MKPFSVFIFTILFFLFYLLPADTAAHSKIDSLLFLLTKNKPDTNQVNHLNSLCWKYRSIGRYDSALHYGNAALDLGKKINFQKGIANSCNDLGNVYDAQGDYPKALEYYFQSLKTNKEAGNKKQIAANLGNIGGVYRNQGDYPKALEYHFQSLKIKEEIGNKSGAAITLGNIGNVYMEQSDYPKALEYYFQALNIKEEAGNKSGIAITLGCIGVVYKQQGDYTKALEYYFKTLKIDEELGNKNNIAAWLGNIGNVYSDQNNYSKALEYDFKALKIVEELGDKKSVALNLGNIGLLYNKQKKYDEAEKYLLNALTLTKELGALNYTKAFEKSINELYFEMGNYKNAYEHHQQYSIAKDSIFSEESSKQIHEMSTKYETEKKEQQIKLLNKDKEIQSKDLERQKTIRNAVVGGLMLVLLFSFLLTNRFLLIRRQKKVIEIEREKSEKLLLNILPKDTADELKRNNAVTPKRYEQVTVMFTDFKGFTTIAEKMTAEELVSELDFIFKKFDEIISKYPIEKIKTIGDAYMCAGGLPVANTTNPMDVVLAALEICEWLKSHQTASSGLMANWQIRIGVHTGSIIAGVVGDKKFAYDIWGDTVNTASRMESSGEAGKVNISGETYKMLAGTRHAVSLRFTFRGKIPAKNKGEIEMYFVEKIS